MKIKASTIESNQRMANAKVAILDLLHAEYADLTQAEWEVLLAELIQDAVRYRLKAERGSDVE